MADIDQPVEPKPIGEVIGKFARRKVAARCADCNAEYQADEAEWTTGEWFRYNHRCDACEAKQRVEAATAEVLRVPAWEQAWLDLAPTDFHRLDLTKLPNRQAHDRAMAWTINDDRPSLFLVGATGQGKTRAMWWKLRAVMQSNPKIRVEAFNCISFGEESRARAYRGQGAEWFDYLSRVDLVVFDDIFRGNITPQAMDELFGLISTRTERRRPTMATSQFTAKTLGQVMQPHHVDAVARRIRDYFTVVNFGDGKEKKK